MAGFATPSRFAGHLHRSAKARHALGSETDHLIGAGHFHVSRKFFDNLTQQAIELIFDFMLDRRQKAKINEVELTGRRPAAVNRREDLGHWEGGLMIFRKEHGSANIACMVERVSRYAVLWRNNDRRSRPLMNGLITMLASLRKGPGRV